jgi:hypothetical protein
MYERSEYHMQAERNSKCYAENPVIRSCVHARVTTQRATS